MYTAVSPTNPAMSKDQFGLMTLFMTGLDMLLGFTVIVDPPEPQYENGSKDYCGEQVLVEEVKSFAAEFGIHNSQHQDSRDVCHVNKGQSHGDEPSHLLPISSETYYECEENDNIRNGIAPLFDANGVLTIEIKSIHGLLIIGYVVKLMIFQNLCVVAEQVGCISNLIRNIPSYRIGLRRCGRIIFVNEYRAIDDSQTCIGK